MGVVLLVLGVATAIFAYANLSGGRRHPHASFSRSPDESTPGWRWSSTGLERHLMLGAAYAAVAVVLLGAAAIRLI